MIGEVHDNPAHHGHQAIAVAEIEPVAIVFEMLSPEQAAELADLPLTDPEAVDEAIGWSAAGWPDFTLYHPIFLAAGEAEIVGGAAPDAAVGAALDTGAAAVFDGDAVQFGLSAPLDGSEQTAREADQMSAHCDALPESVLPGMVEAQRLRDATMAAAALEAFERRGGPVVVIAGTGHARTDRGIPAALATAAPHVEVLSIGQLEGVAGDDLPYDLWLTADPPAREDPCLAFR